ncbi:MAG: threonylcarbamoyl-AMP synthase [Clostridiales bacterium]|jgi:L-threonylcarbamoyladenylate synthase|nr:threonylcarbamoyl-AMP synthase [Clostridiales bacterium]
MITEIINSNDKKAMQRAADLIKSGGVVAFPTETVYGLGANAFDGAAVEGIFTAKGRPADNPLIVHIENMNMIESIAVGIPDDFYLLYEKFMPGPLTVVLHKNKKISDAVTAGLDTVAVRFPRHRTAAELIKKSGCPIAAPSANISAHVSPTTAEHVFADLNGRIPMIIDGGECSVGIESTILDLTGDTPVILRPGAITLDMLRKTLKEVAEVECRAETPKAPGMKYRHYSPNAELRLTGNRGEAAAFYDEAAAAGKNVALIVKASNAPYYGSRNIFVIPDDAKGYAKKIYALLRLAETSSDTIICESPETSGAGASVLNRLNKAVGKSGFKTDGRSETL